MEMPFGKHKGKLLAEVPTDYLEWVLTLKELNHRLRFAIECELEFRDARVRPRPNPQPKRDESRVDLSAMVEKWYRRLAVEFHPDHGGSDAAMKAINRGRDLLLEMVRR